MTKKGDEPEVSASGKHVTSFWDALKAEGFIPARAREQVVIREGHPEVPLTRYRPSQQRPTDE